MSRKRVIVGMSGGVDSSVTAALLKERGYDVIGVTLQLLQKEAEHLGGCCNITSVNDARRVAARLDIPHYTINLREPFKKNVIDHFVESYVTGMTPNPCVECNRYIKFGEMQKIAKDLGASHVATGHYVKVQKDRNGNLRLYKGIDCNKDQSYFLYMLTQEELKTIMFPLGRYSKPKVREMAHKYQLVNADKADSQEICFVTKDDYKAFVENQVENSELKTGNIVTSDGSILGQHNGIHRFTIGQRKGLGISSAAPLYVLKIDSVSYTVTVGSKEELKSKDIHCKQFTLVNAAEPVVGKWFGIKLRYQMVPIRGQVISMSESGECHIRLNTPQSFIAPGQSAVLYIDTRVVGGGVITGSEK